MKKLTERQKLILSDDWLPKDMMEKDIFYVCKARNFRIGMWNGESFTYYGIQDKIIYEDTEDHWDDGPPFGTVKPYKRVESK